MTRWLFPAIFLLPLLLGVSAADSPAPLEFTDVTETSGIAFRHTFGDSRFSKILKATGSGVGIFDYDGDGDLDLYFVNGTWLPEVCDEAGKVNEGATNRLYRNDGADPATGNLRFTDVTEAAGVGNRGYGMGCVVGDVDNDGDQDLYVTNYGPNVLYRNNGDGTFTDATAAAGVAGPEKLCGWKKWSTNAVLFDYDRDGRLDLWVSNYLAFDPTFNQFYGPEGFPGPLNYLGQPSRLYRNRGDGTFEDVTEKAGVLREDGRGMGASVADFNGDGWPDVYEANDAQRNYLFLNRGDGTFEEVGDISNAGRGQGGENTASMHGAIADYDNDGAFDIFVPDTNYFSLFRNLTAEMDGTIWFDDMTARSGLAGPCGKSVGWGGFFFDYDNDGWRDIFVATGEAHRPENQPKMVLRNLGADKDGLVRYAEVSMDLGKRVFWERRLSRGAAAGDLDNDGDLDVVVVNIDLKAKGKEGLPTILRNDGGNRMAWLDFRLRGTASNRDGIGARITVTAEGRTRVGQAESSPSYLSSTEARVHFGLGNAAVADRVVIEWPSGTKQVMEGVKTGRLVTVTEPAKSGGGR